MDKIIVVGGGGHARVVISLLRKLNIYDIFGYVDKADKGNVAGLKYLGNDDVLAELIKKDAISLAVIGVGSVNLDNKRANLYARLSKMGYSFPVIISPDAVVNKDVVIGEGTVVMDGVVLGIGTKVGEGCIINTHATIDHDCTIGNFVHIATGAILSGGIKVGNNSLIGVGTVVVQYKTIVSECLVGAGAVVTADCMESGTYLGVPARRIK